ncbi:MAG TPA: dihydrofolate reductase family protein [Candidatus Lokiarchaeia archaeon]|nr:dihydrofolate reductase family protein [Candidatus Lokiarchaeia archaeon]
MRQLFLFMMVSIDGYFETGPNGLDWHNVDEEFNAFAHEQDSTVDTILFGRKTYEMMVRFWPTPEAENVDPETATFMNETQKIVVSHAPFTAEWNNTTVISKNIVNQVKKLKDQPGNDIAILGSNELCVTLMEAGMVDEFRIMVNPIALGKGNSLFTGLTEKVKLKLLWTRDFASGNILLCYAPV